MGCSSCANKDSGSTPSVSAPQGKVQVREPKDPNCTFTGGILRIWYTILKCVKDNGKLSKIGLVDYQANSYLGFIQSAINFPDDYCRFSDKLTDFQTNILPRIIANVPECL